MGSARTSEARPQWRTIRPRTLVREEWRQVGPPFSAKEEVRRVGEVTWKHGYAQDR